jgi:hypothetical protein
MKRGKFILPDGFKGKDYIKNKETLVSNCHELNVNVLRQYLSHYLLNNLPVQFVAYSSLTWFPHFFNVSFKKYQFKVICQCDKGPVVIEHENSVGVAFHPQVNYPETIKLLENFIIRKFQDLQEKLFSFKKPEIKIEDNELPLMFRNYKLNDEQKRGKKLLDEQYITNNQSNVGKVNSSRSFNRIKKVRNVAGHVGFGFNNRDMIFVENNAIIQKNILYDKKKIQEIISPEKKREELINDMFSIKRNENTRISAIFQPIISNNNRTNLNQNEIIKSLKEGKNMEDDDQNGMEYMIFIDKGKMDEKQLISYYKKVRTWAVNVSVVTILCFVLNVSCVDCDTSFSFFRSRVDVSVVLLFCKALKSECLCDSCCKSCLTVVNVTDCTDIYMWFVTFKFFLCHWIFPPQ